jgi:hypothetical protein
MRTGSMPRQDAALKSRRSKIIWSSKVLAVFCRFLNCCSTPRALWPNVIPTLRFIRDQIVPALGPVTAVSGYREPQLNACAGGATHSAHALYFALDLVPEKTMTRSDLIATVCRLHARFGAAYHVGLGFYQGLRFHIDTHGFRRWGADWLSATSPCVTG